MKLSLVLVSLVFTSQVYAKDTKTTATTTTATATAAATTPADTCNKLVEAAKAEDFATVQTISTVAAGKRGKAEGKFKKMHHDYLGKIKGITCGTAYIAEETAFVEAQAEGKKRFIPFVNENGTWKFNVQAYKAMYTGEHGQGAAHGKKAM